MDRSFLMLAGAAAVLALASGCASSEPVASADPYAKLAFVGAPDLYEHDRVAPLERPRQWVGPAGAELLAVAYGGVEGAREAHAMYPREIAEKLDGRCEPFVTVATGETLASMADLCDVDIAKLVAFNPGVSNPYELPVGLAVKVPGADRLGPVSGIASLSGDLIGLYEIDRGESISDVAARFDVSLTTILDMNPEARWRTPSAGELVRVPAAAPAKADVLPTTGAQWVGYGPIAAEGAATGDVDAATAVALSHMPYAQQPTGAAPAPNSSANSAVALWTSSSMVREGADVTVRLSGARPGERVTFFRGKTTTDEDASVTVIAGADGVAEATFRTPTTTSDLGGYVFRAETQSGSRPYYSQRVGVMKLKKADAAR